METMKGKLLTEEKAIHKRWTEYCMQLCGPRGGAGYACHFSVSQHCDGAAYLLSVAVYLRCPQGGQLLICYI